MNVVEIESFIINFCGADWTVYCRVFRSEVIRRVFKYCKKLNLFVSIKIIIYNRIKIINSVSYEKKISLYILLRWYVMRISFPTYKNSIQELVWWIRKSRPFSFPRHLSLINLSVSAFVASIVPLDLIGIKAKDFCA